MGNLNDVEFSYLLNQMQTRFNRQFEYAVPLFTTSVDLWKVFIEAIPEKDRQYHTCHCCRKFIEEYGGLVTIDSNKKVSAIWSMFASSYYQPVIQKMLTAITNSKVTGVFYTDSKSWGHRKTGEWQHFALTPTKAMVYKNKIKTPRQAMAEKAEEFLMLSRALENFSKKTIETALAITQSELLYRNEKISGHAQWFHDLYMSKPNHDMLWLAVANAFPGVCHVNSSMLGTLLEDIQDGKDFDAISKSFAAKMEPTKYLRPKTISEGNIEQAEKLVEKLGVKNALRRRFARLEDCVLLWWPKSKEASSVFGHLKTKSSIDLSTKSMNITWEKFQEKVLPTAVSIEYFVPGHRTSFTAAVTRVDDSDPPILQWDSEELRNSVSLYMYSQGSLANQWRLTSGTYVSVTGITLRPDMWYGVRSRHKGALFILKGAMDTRSAGLALFPEILKSEFHSIRSTIERYSSTGEIQGRNEGNVCGILISAGGNNNQKFKVDNGKNIILYNIDRWE